MVSFEASIKNGIIEVPIEYRNIFMEPVFVEIRVKNEKEIARDSISRLLDKGNEHGKKYGITEDVINKEIELYREEKRNK